MNKLPAIFNCIQCDQESKVNFDYFKPTAISPFNVTRENLFVLCRDCAISNEKKTIFKDIHNALNQINCSLNDKIIHIITSFSIGYIFVCSNNYFHYKTQEIIFDNKYDFEKQLDTKGDEIYYYKTTQYNTLHPIQCINNQKIRIFCKSCTQNHLIQCQKSKCNIKDIKTSLIKCYNTRTRNDIFACHNHEKCNFCHKPTTMDLFTDEIINCRTCSNRMHRGCANRGICSKCCSDTERRVLFIPIKKSLEHILYISLINIIVDYVMGFSIPCSSCYEINKTMIHFHSQWQHNKKTDQNGEQIQYYQLTKHNKLASDMVYGKQIRAFCHACKTVVIKCYRCISMDIHSNFYVDEHGSYICYNHEKCVLCNAAVRWQSNCDKCHRAVCKNCKQTNHKWSEKCKGCIEKEQNDMKNRLRIVIMNSGNCLFLKTNVLNVLIDYAIGWVFMCCNDSVNCMNYIVCNSIRQLKYKCTVPSGNELELTYYKLEDEQGYGCNFLLTKDKRLQRFPKKMGCKLRIFCDDCQFTLKCCLWRGCDNYDLGDVCVNHSGCWECYGKDVRNCDKCKIKLYSYND
eukprot:362240_1